jgi:hypothetical protein
MTPSRRPAFWAYSWWLAAGSLLGFGIAALLTIGPILISAAALSVGVGVALPRLRNRAALATVGGLGCAPLYIAWLNREGPGRVCTSDSAGTSCFNAWSPWPFVAVGCAFILVAVLLIVPPTRRQA